MTRDKIRSKASWSTEVKVITFIVISIFFVCVYLAMNSDIDASHKLMVTGLLAITSIVTYAYSPLYIQVLDGNFEILKTIGKISIPIADIVEIERIDRKSVGGWRIFGSGGVFGYLGKFKNRRLGSYNMYVTDRDDMILITTRDKKYVVSCDDADQVVDAIKVKLN